MAKSLVIVESPAKAKTINRYLGNDYIVTSSVGHIRDLPTGASKKAPVDPKERAKKAAETRKLPKEEKERIKAQRARDALVKRMGVDPENNWAAQYEILPGKEKVIRDLKKQAKDVDTIYLATDLDREGEAIAWHLQSVIGGDDSRYRRVVFNEITKKAIQSAFKDPGDVDQNYVNAQQARRFLDRVVGFMLSPLLWKKISRGLSAGRVQSVAVKLVVEKERSIRAFIPEEYWDIHADMLSQKVADATRFLVDKFQGKALKLPNKAATDTALDALKNAQYVVKDRTDKPTKSRPNAPLITSTLQQAASGRLGFGVKKTMMLAQRLYEAGYITYMRTDATHLSNDAIHMIRDYVGQTYGDKYLPEKPRIYATKSGAQEAHEAIRPTDITRQSKNLPGDVDADAKRLYDLIWRQTVACQMSDAIYDATTIILEAGEYQLRARGRVMRFAGWTKVLPAMKKSDDDGELPDLQVGDTLDLKKLDPKQHFTKPPGRFTEASLVKELEKRGIGRPSTYASIISTIQDRGYVSLNKRRFYAEKIGEVVSDRLSDSFSDLMDYDFTATMEARLDEIARGERDWKKSLDGFYEDFTHKLGKAEAPFEDGGMKNAMSVNTDIPCDACGRPLAIRYGGSGVFLGCTGYSDKENPCKETVNLVDPDDVVINASTDEQAGVEEALKLRERRRCPLCGSSMHGFVMDETRKLHICTNSPNCNGFEVEKGTFEIKGYEGPTLECDKCGSDMQLKDGRFGRYFGCTSETCKNTRKLLKDGTPAPPKADPIDMPELKCQKVDDHYVLRDGASGLFLAASGFPKNRETRAPKLAEIRPHKDKMEAKFQYLFDGPDEDPDGNPTILRFSRKTKSQFIGSEKDGKATKWKLEYKDGQWV